MFNSLYSYKRQRTSDFSELITNELLLRGQGPLGSWTVRRDKLRMLLRSEVKLRKLQDDLKHGDREEGALFCLIQAIPCILHLENRVGIKLFTMILIEGLSNARKGLIYTDLRAEGLRLEHFFERVELLVNSKILGDDDNVSEWICPRSENRKEVGAITMDNVRCRRVVENFELLVDECCFVGDESNRKDLWLSCMPWYRSGICKLRSKEDFTPEDVASFQNDIDEFFQRWVELWGLEGCTNYIHLLSSGHISTYLFKWRNLYRHSQQGWEALNSLLKTFYFRRTAHGGAATGQGKGKKSNFYQLHDGCNEG